MNLKDLLSDIPKSLEFNVDLPSRGRFYKSYDPSKGVKVTRITYQTELDLVAKRAENGFKPIDFLLERHCKGVDHLEFLAMDRFAVLLKLREVSYGNEYHSKTHCSNCGAENVLTFSVKDFPINYVPLDFKDPREVILPVLNKKAEVRFPRKYDTDLMGQDTIGAHLWRFIESIENCSDKAQISEVLSDERFPLKDIKVLIDAVLSEEYGIQTNAAFKCISCGHIGEAHFEINPDFFSFSS